jgi:hypothetical protein
LKFLTVLTVAVAAAMVTGQTAEAHLVTKSKKKDTLKTIAKKQKINLAHSRYVCENGRRIHKRWACKAQRWLGRELRQTRAKLVPYKPVWLGSLSCISCWDRVASCESGGNWSYNGSSGFDGGLQFLPSTWLGNGGGRYAPFAYMASRIQQISIASTMDLGQWPVCGSRY